MFVKRLSIPHTALNELRPVRHYRNWIGLLRQEPPKRWMMPAEFMLCTVAMLTYALSQRLYFFDELLPRHRLEVRVHDCLKHR